MNEPPGMDDASMVQFLWNAAMKLRAQNDERLLPIVKQLREKSLSHTNVGVQSNSFQLSEVCKHCGCPWSEGNFRLKILHHSNKMKKIAKRNSLDVQYSTKFKKNLATLITKRKDNVMVRKCNICGKAQKIGLRKPLVPKTDIIENSLVNENIVIEKKKRKRKKDRFSGLLPSAVVNARLSLCSSDSFDVNTSTSTINGDSILSNITLPCDTKIEKISESNTSDISCNNLCTAVSQTTNTNSEKKIKLTHNPLLHNKNNKKRKKKKKSSVSEFLKFI